MKNSLKALGLGILSLSIISSTFFLYPHTTRASAALVAHLISQIAENTASSAINTTGANLLIMTTVHNDASAETVSDSLGNTWTALTPKNQFAAVQTTIYYAKNPTVGSSQTFQ